MSSLPTNISCTIKQSEEKQSLVLKTSRQIQNRKEKEEKRSKQNLINESEGPVNEMMQVKEGNLILGNEQMASSLKELTLDTKDVQKLSPKKRREIRNKKKKEKKYNKRKLNKEGEEALTKNFKKEEDRSSEKSEQTTKKLEQIADSIQLDSKDSNKLEQIKDPGAVENLSEKLPEINNLSLQETSPGSNENFEADKKKKKQRRNKEYIKRQYKKKKENKKRKKKDNEEITSGHTTSTQKYIEIKEGDKCCKTCCCKEPSKCGDNSGSENGRVIWDRTLDSMPTSNPEAFKTYDRVPEDFVLIDKKALKQANESLYFMENSYKMVIESFKKYGKVLLKNNASELEKKNEFLRLNFIIENSSIQFQSCMSSFPKEEILQSFLNKFNHTLTSDFNNFSATCPELIKDTLNFGFNKMNKVLSNEDIPFLEIQPVNAIHPESLLKSVIEMQKSYAKTDMDRKELEKLEDVLASSVSSSWGEFSLL